MQVGPGLAAAPIFHLLRRTLGLVMVIDHWFADKAVVIGIPSFLHVWQRLSGFKFTHRVSAGLCQLVFASGP